jgi:putative sterol carrier protein
MLSDLTNLPRTIVPEAFFEKVMELVADIQAPPEAAADRALVRLEGVGGGEWNVGFLEGRAQIREGTISDPTVQLSLSVIDWREFVVGRVRDVVTPGMDTNLLDPRMVVRIFDDREAVEAVRDFKGTLRLTVRDVAEDSDYVLFVTLGSQAETREEPATTVEISLEDLASLVRQDSTPQTAFFAGQIRIDGDMNLAMALMTLTSN